MTGKSPITSKTLWINIVAVAAMLAQGQLGFVVGPEYQASALGVVNLVLRAVTKKPLDWTAPAKNQRGWAHSLMLPWMALLLAVVIGLSGCAGTTVGDGKVDAVEEATIKISVGLAMTAAPQTIAPAYAVSTALLMGMDGVEQIALGLLNAAVEREVAGLDLLETERQSVYDLVDLVRARIHARLSESGVTDPDQRRVIVRTVIRIVRDATAARLGVTTTVNEWPDLFAGVDLDAIIERAAEQTDFKLRLRQQLLVGRQAFEDLYGL